jgi:cytochrome b561
MKRAAQLGHLALYLLMGAALAAGLATLFLRGRGIDAFLFTIPSPIAENRVQGRSAKEVHEVLSFALIGLTGLHVAAALWHQFVLRDHALARMAAPR